MEKQIKLFLQFLENEKRASSNTLQSYKRDILQYQDYINQSDLNYLKVDSDDLNSYFEYMKKQGRKTSTISRAIASVRAFYQFLVRTKKIKKDPTSEVKTPKIEKKVPSILTEKEVEKKKLNYY